MNANFLGKSLVFLHLVLSMLALSCSAAIYLQFVDWGWKEPRQELNYQVASHIDKRVAAYKLALANRDLHYRPLKQGKESRVSEAQEGLHETQTAFAQNHLYFEKELARLKSDPADEIEVKAPSENIFDLDPAESRTGKPALGEVIPSIKKSLASYEKDRQKLKKDAEDVSTEVTKWIKEGEIITTKLNGFDKEGKKTKTGIYDLREEEITAQAQIKFEREYLEPRLVNAEKEAEIYAERKKRLEEDLVRANKKPR
jgi:hypothetical protein